VNALRFVAAKWPIVALLAFVNLSVLALVWLSLESSHRQFQERAEISSRNTNRLVAQSVAGDIDRIDLALRAVADEVTRLDRAPDRLEPFLSRLQSRLPMADNIRVSDADGLIIAGAGGVPAGVTIHDRDYFLKLRDRAGADLAISQPVLGRVSNKGVLIFARRSDLAHGGFGGVVFASVTIEWFERKFNELEVGAAGTVVMRGDASRDFDLLARVPHAGHVGQTKVSDTFRARITAKPEGDTYQAAAGADGIHRTFSYRPVGHYPLITLVGLATEDYVGEWRREATKLAVLAGAFLLVTVLGGAGLLRTWRALVRRTEELARSNADLEQFAYVASHDLQSPLRNISGYAQLLARRYKGRLDQDADEFIDFIVGGAQHMSAMIPDLLDYARASTAPQILSEVKLDDIMRSVLTNLGSVIATTGAEITVAPLPAVLAEPRQAESLLQNLVENALTYRAPGRTPRISITAEPGPAGMWRLAVADNGIGIEPQYFEKIFVVFQRLEPNRFPGGTGIGLALCRRIVTRFGGTIWVESQPDAGTTFFVTLRDAAAPEPAG
jgi:signal transduction histidine kinase